jgi:hypothetical protein
MFKLNNDQVSAGIWLALGVIIAISSVPYKLGTMESPRGGFLPFLTGLGIAFFAFLGLVHGTLKQRQGAGWKAVMRGVNWRKSLMVMVALFAYALVLKFVGFILCTALFIGFLLRAVQPQKWPVVIAGAILTAVSAYGIFEIWLKAQLPRGPWGF